MHPCGHVCLGFFGEQNCLPCLEKDCLDKYNKENQVKIPNDCTSDQYCHICWSEELAAKPCIWLDCQHVFHLDCIMKKVKGRWFSPRIVFGFLNCPECKLKISAAYCPELTKETTEIVAFEKLVMKKALERAKFEGIDKEERLKDPADYYYNKL